MTDRQYRNRVLKIKALEEQAAELKKQAAAIAEEIQAALGDEEVKDIDGFRIFWKWRAGAKTFDKSRFGKQYPDLLEEFTVTKDPTRFFRIDPVK